MARRRKGGAMAHLDLPGCGDPADALLRGGEVLVIMGEFPSLVERAGDGSFTGSVTVTNHGPLLTGVSSPEADVFVVQAGEVVSTPLAQDLIARPIALETGASQSISARGSMLRCTDGDLLPVGSYDVFAVLVIHVDDGSQTVTSGGPWSIRVADGS